MDAFQSIFGTNPSIHSHASGRVNLIGEHTDYNDGYVLPTQIPQRTSIQLACRSDAIVRAASRSMDGLPAEYQLTREARRRHWIDYVQGVTCTLRHAGYTLHGFDLLIASDVPVGRGLSSSAALDVALMRALRAAFQLELNDVQIARLGQRVENDFVGAQVGIMDPMVCSAGRERFALFLDARSLEHQLVPLPPDADLVVINSGVAHHHSAGDYNTRRAECERACALLGVAKLRDLSVSDLPRVDALAEPLNRRARHVITENARVLEAVDALRRNDLLRLGQLFNASHDSQRDDYAVSVPEIDLLIELARSDEHVYGARLTGGGFGGSIVMLTRGGTGRACADRVVTNYAARTGHHATILVPPEHLAEPDAEARESPRGLKRQMQKRNS
jgi:galactokinase